MAVVTEKFSNNGSSTLNGAIGSSDVTLTLNSASSFPNAGQFRVLIESEIILVGAIAGAVCSSLQRGYENTTAASHTNGAAVTQILTVGSLANNPRSMTASGDFEYLNSSGIVTRLAAPSDGTYGVNFASGVPSWASGLLPTGVVLPYAGAAAPTGFLIANGSAVSRTTYSALFAAIGTAYGAGDGSTTFNIPDMRQKFPLGVAASGTGNTLGATGGTIDHTHTSAAHTHTGSVTGTTDPTDINHTHNLSTVSGAFNAGPYNVSTNTTTGNISGSSILQQNFTASFTTASTTPGNTGSANPPFVTFNYIIKT